jgi:hypothetical protein
MKNTYPHFFENEIEHLNPDGSRKKNKFLDSIPKKEKGLNIGKEKIKFKAKGLENSFEENKVDFSSARKIHTLGNLKPRIDFYLNEEGKNAEVYFEYQSFGTLGQRGYLFEGKNYVVDVFHEGRDLDALEELREDIKGTFSDKFYSVILEGKKAEISKK